MFSTRLSEVVASEVEAVVQQEAAESIDFELKRSLPAKRGADPWMTGGKLGDDAKDELAEEIVAFANTLGGTVIVGIGEDAATKRAKPPLFPIPNCKEAAARLHQAISDRIEPKLPIFECEGVVTEKDGTSGVIIMRTLESYLAPHRHTQSNHCYVRRNDRAERMSMLEIQEMTRQKARSAVEAEKSFEQSSDRFHSWIPQEHQRTHPYPGVQGSHTEHGTTNVWVGIWAARVTARPFSPILLANLSKQPWLRQLDTSAFNGTGQIQQLGWWDLSTTRAWAPRLRAIEREFEGTNSLGLDRVSSEGLIERFVWQKQPEHRRPRHGHLRITELLWNVASVVRAAALIRAVNSRSTMHFGLEVELMTSDPLLIHGYPTSWHAIIPASTTTFPRYEIGDAETFDELMMTVDKDLWNLGGYHPSWELGVVWTKTKPSE